HFAIFESDVLPGEGDPRTDDEPGRGRVVGNNVFQAEGEVPVPTVDDFQCGSHMGGHRRGNVPWIVWVQVRTQQEGHIGFDTWMDQRTEVDPATVGDRHGSGECTDDDVGNTHLGCLGLAGEAELDPDDPVATIGTQGQARMLYLICLVEAQRVAFGTW